MRLGQTVWTAHNWKLHWASRHNAILPVTAVVTLIHENTQTEHPESFTAWPAGYLLDCIRILLNIFLIVHKTTPWLVSQLLRLYSWSELTRLSWPRWLVTYRDSHASFIKFLSLLPPILHIIGLAVSMEKKYNKLNKSYSLFSFATICNIKYWLHCYTMYAMQSYPRSSQKHINVII